MVLTSSLSTSSHLSCFSSPLWGSCKGKNEVQRGPGCLFSFISNNFIAQTNLYEEIISPGIAFHKL
jgi:hypothetical protein